MRAVILTILAIVFIGVIIIAVGYNINVTEKDGRKTITKETVYWLKGVGNNIKGLVGMTVTQDWLPEVNKTRLNENETENEKQENQTQTLKEDKR
ncbi:MAG TPA: hypothetical protein HA282_01790 [Nanoarchaeota archaeon]|nr:MAG: hypothetical protein QT01_C0005G0040 [archaeon GW2011_AR6]MBS3082643.1 hypothetical protein [Candidatus Pacearchaeota archaeon]HIH17418.1 hypothetical protein [Nanoarchaeota archaeon]HIH34362.1 hypothetical protein [Nanoarchaeota archaeon]HIH51888.1 hypothetical protein [Nanoarchaeota archaeon]